LISAKNHKINTLLEKEGYTLKVFNLCEEIYDIANKHNFHIEKINVLALFSAYYSIAGNWEEAISNYKYIITEIKKIRQDSILSRLKNRGLIIGAFYNYTAKAYIRIKNTDSSSYYNDLMLKELEGVGVQRKRYWTGEYYISKGDINILLLNFELAKTSFNEAFNRLDSVSRFDRSLQKAYLYGKIEFKQNNYKNAIERIRPAVEKQHFHALDSSYLQEAYKVLAYSYKYSSKKDISNDYFEKYAQTFENLNKNKSSVVSSILNTEKAKFNSISAKYNLSIREQKFSILLFVFTLFFSWNYCFNL